jgi:methyl-accepting chemotaxis protein
MKFIIQIEKQWGKMFRFYLLLQLIIFSISMKCAFAQDDLTIFDLQVKKWAEDCKKEATEELEMILSSGRLTMGQLFDTFYIPIPNTDPQKFHTQYDKYSDQILQIILDKYLEKDKRILFVVIVDVNGYLPTHNLKYSKNLTGDQKTDLLNNRTKRMFNDKTGLAAARNTKPYFMQKYSRDTGETMIDMSVPIFIREKHWGAIRFGYIEK